MGEFGVSADSHRTRAILSARRPRRPPPVRRLARNRKACDPALVARVVRLVSLALCAAAAALTCRPPPAPPPVRAPIEPSSLPRAPAPTRGTALEAVIGAVPRPSSPSSIRAADGPFRLAFGSCSDLSRPINPWPSILATKPDVWIWLGDNIYADTEDVARMRELYQQTKAHPDYAQLLVSATVIGTWDDHDYGANNAGKEYPQRDASQAALLDFLDEPADSLRRHQAGVNAAYDLGPDGRRIRVILLDTRYHRDEPGPDGDVLGETQWRWLESQLRGSPSRAHVLVSSIQVVADEQIYEKWGNFPRARARLLALLDEVAPRNLIVLSGDRHFAELSRLPLPAGAALVDVTSSSLSRPLPSPPDEPNRYRVGAVYPGVNFGLLEYDWAGGRLHVSIRDDAGRPRIVHIISLD
ncbi:MAG: alkaline phosphatase family protein [Myxococcales bacterium FL481]|nr:MAG: alkaline phosphatase family protein [Myxococcales bacterium FL481]